MDKDLQWIEDIPISVPATTLKPKDKFKIVSLTGVSEKDWQEFIKIDPYSHIFIMDEKECFSPKYGNKYLNTVRPNFDGDIWIYETIDHDNNIIYVGEWISVVGMEVIILNK